MTRYVLQLSEVRGVCLSEDAETFTASAADWQLFDTATEATLASFGLPFPTEVHLVGADLAGSSVPHITTKL